MKCFNQYPKFMQAKQVAASLLIALALAGNMYAQDKKSAAVPFDLPQFKQALLECRLQSPSTSKALASGKEFDGFSKPGRFYLAEDGSTMVLATDQDGRDRSELRYNGHFSVTGPEKRLTARLRFDKPTSLGKARLHFIQIHIKDFLGNDKGPLLMVSWRETGDRITAKVRQDFVSNDKKNKIYDLGPRPDKFTTVDVRVKSGKLRIFVDDKKMVEEDVSDFAKAPCYFKVGCYTRDLAAHAVEFESLSIQTK